MRPLLKKLDETKFTSFEAFTTKCEQENKNFTNMLIGPAKSEILEKLQVQLKSRSEKMMLEFQLSKTEQLKEQARQAKMAAEAEIKKKDDEICQTIANSEALTQSFRNNHQVMEQKFKNDLRNFEASEAQRQHEREQRLRQDAGGNRARVSSQTRNSLNSELDQLRTQRESMRQSNSCRVAHLENEARSKGV